MFPNDNKCARARPKKLALSAISDVGEKDQLWGVGCALCRRIQIVLFWFFGFKKKEIRMGEGPGTLEVGGACVAVSRR